MSPEMRARISKGVAKLHELGFLSQIPDFSEADLTNVGYRRQAPAWEDAEIRPSKPVIPQQSAIQEDSGSQRMLIIAILAAAIVCAIGGVAFFTLQQGF